MPAQTILIELKKACRVMTSSVQFCPFDYPEYKWDFKSPGTSSFNATNGKAGLSNWFGNSYQEAASAVVQIDPDAFEQTSGNFDMYGFEYSPSRDEGYITWFVLA